MPNPALGVQMVHRLQIDLTLSLNPHRLPRPYPILLALHLHLEPVFHVGNPKPKGAQKPGRPSLNLANLQSHCPKTKVQGDIFFTLDTWVCGGVGLALSCPAKGDYALAVFDYLQL